MKKRIWNMSIVARVSNPVRFGGAFTVNAKTSRIATHFKFDAARNKIELSSDEGWLSNVNDDRRIGKASKFKWRRRRRRDKQEEKIVMGISWRWLRLRLRQSWTGLSEKGGKCWWFMGWFRKIFVHLIRENYWKSSTSESHLYSEWNLVRI